MKNSVISISVFFLILMAFSGFAWGKAPVGVSKGVHNLSTSSADPWGRIQYISNNDEICVFCHTPHSGSLNGPLWNRPAASPASWSHYNTATLTAVGVSASRIPNNESMLCLSCHDGSVGVFRVINVPPTEPGETNPIEDQFGGNAAVEISGFPGGRIGATVDVPDGTGDLSDDHPISFSYADVWTEYNNNSRNDLRLASQAITYGVQFFGSDNRLECSSCHDPHADVTVPGYDSFLITTNSGSKLCLACHIK
ncbi:MAG: cytochrome c3 family protein [Desulfuromonadales bacterium]